MKTKSSLKYWTPILIGLFATVYIAYAQGVFNEKRISIGYGGHPMKNNSLLHIYVAVNKAISDNDEIIIPLRFSISNTGDEPLSDVKLNFKTPKNHPCINPDIYVFLKTSGSLTTNQIYHQFNNGDNSCDSVYELRKMNINSEIGIQDAIVAKKSNRQSMTLGLAPFLGENLVSIEASGIREKEYEVVYHVVYRDNIDSLENWFKEYYVKHLAFEKRKNHSFVGYLIKLIFDEEKETILLASYSYGSIDHENKKTWLPTDNKEEIREVQYNLYSRSLLFDN